MSSGRGWLKQQRAMVLRGRQTGTIRALDGWRCLRTEHEDLEHMTERGERYVLRHELDEEPAELTLEQDLVEYVEYCRYESEPDLLPNLLQLELVKLMECVGVEP